MQDGNATLRRIWRNTPNTISIARLCATTVLLASVLFHRVEIFKWLLLACLLSDILDGLIARTFHLTSKLGASLDSLADVVTMLIGFLGVFVFQKAFVSEHYPGVLLVACLLRRRNNRIAMALRQGLQLSHAARSNCRLHGRHLRHVAFLMGLSRLAVPIDRGCLCGSAL